MPRYAYLANPSESSRSGATNDKYTGVWECGVVPAANKSSVKEGKINVGVWKNSTSGEKIDSHYTGTLPDDVTLATASYAENDNGKCYGNGTDNAVLAYVVMPSSSTYHIETAQKR